MPASKLGGNLNSGIGRCGDFYDIEFGTSQFISYILFERDIDHSKGYSELFSDAGAEDSLFLRQKVKFLKYIRSGFGVFIHF
jgi:hypothetical protein